MTLNNYDWWEDVKLLEFLENVRWDVRLRTVVAKESLEKRLEHVLHTDFTYQFLQGYDFLYLFQDEGVRIRIGGSVQWGILLLGLRLTRKILQAERAYGLTMPLILRSDGTKFEKSEDGVIWLFPLMLSPLQVLRYFLSVPDSDVVRLLKVITFLDLEEIDQLQMEVKRPSYALDTARRIGSGPVCSRGFEPRPTMPGKLDWKTMEGTTEDALSGYSVLSPMF